MYGELVKRLKIAAQFADKGLLITPSLCLEAADAIEEQQNLNCELLFRVGQAEALIDYYQTGRMISNEPPEEE